MSIDCIQASNANAPLWAHFAVTMKQERDGGGHLGIREPGNYTVAATWRTPQVGWTPLEDWQPPAAGGHEEPVHYKETYLSQCALVHAGDWFNTVRVTFVPQGDLSQERSPDGKFLVFYLADADRHPSVWRPLEGWIRVPAGKEHSPQSVLLSVPKGDTSGTLVTSANTQPSICMSTQWRAGQGGSAAVGSSPKAGSSVTMEDPRDEVDSFPALFTIGLTLAVCMIFLIATNV